MLPLQVCHLPLRSPLIKSGIENWKAHWHLFSGTGQDVGIRSAADYMMDVSCEVANRSLGAHGSFPVTIFSRILFAEVRL